MAAAASVQRGQGTVLWRMFQSKVLQSKAYTKNQRKTSVITIPMELRVGLGEAGRIPVAQGPASPETPSPRAGKAGRFPKGFPEFASSACWQLSMRKNV